jgi:uncharacterized membrane protein
VEPAPQVRRWGEVQSEGSLAARQPDQGIGEGPEREHGPAPAATPTDISRSTHRIEAFSDGFFAIVITLLVLELKVPELPDPADDFLLGREVLKLWPAIASFAVSFINIYILWVAHHELIRITTRASTRFLYLNGGLLFGIAMMPFSTALLSGHLEGPSGQMAATIYTGVLLWVAAFYNLLWRYLGAHPDRLLPTVTRHDRRRITRTYAVTLLLYLAAFGLSWVAPLASILITVALAVFFAVIDRLSGFASEDIAEAETPEEADAS